MVKQRMSTADIAAEIGCLREKHLVGMRVTNVYDVNSKVYVIKLARSGEDGEKVLLLIESGIRMHTIDEMPDKPDVPSNFTLKLRKHIRSRRLEDIRQLGSDRIAQLTFSTGENEVKLILEFYAQGNVILADSSYQVMTLLRSHRDDSKGTATMSRHIYPIQTVRLRTPTPVEKIRQGLQECKSGTTLKNVISNVIDYGPIVAEFCCINAEFDPKRMPAEHPLEEHEQDRLMSEIRKFEKWVDSCEDKAPKGCICSNRKGEYMDYAAIVNDKPSVHQLSGEITMFPSFDDAVAHFYGKIHGQRAESQQKQKEKSAKAKLEAIRNDHKARLKNLYKEQEAAEHKALVLECNLQFVDAAINSVREALATGMSWDDLGTMIESEKESGNPVAQLIDSLKLDRNKISLLLNDPDFDHDGTSGKVVIEVDLSLSAHANASAYYDAKKKFADKARRTLEANERALVAAEKKALANLEKIQNLSIKTSASAIRKHYWFEKFNWFISSENYLVISGRDAQQNDILVKRYLKKGDIYVHADLHGASSTIVKNKDPTSKISPLTLSEAGQACVARSAAWSAKVVTSAWWVYPEQVSKTAPTGEYLTTGSMMIRGRKNYLSPQPLVMGIAWLFKLEEGSIAAHLGERAPRELGLEGAATEKSTLHLEGSEIDTADDQEKSAFEKFMESSIDILSNNRVSQPPIKQNSRKKTTEQPEKDNKASEDLSTQSKAPKKLSKAKKALMKKYKDQDEEERELAMALLQPHGKKKDKKTRKKERKARIAAQKARASGIDAPEITTEHIEKLTARLQVDKGVDSDKDSDDESLAENEVSNSDSHLSSEEEQHVAAVDATSTLNVAKKEHESIPSARDAEDIADLMAEEGIGMLDESEKEKLTMLDELTGCPRSEDTVLFAVPVGAPYQVVSNYKYHVKLIPGTQKKGKAYRQAVELVTTRKGPNVPKDASSQTEMELIRGIPEMDGINSMLASVKLQIPGLQKIQAQKKKSQKKCKK